MSFGDQHTCRVEGVEAVCITLYDETMRELKVVSMFLRCRRT